MPKDHRLLVLVPTISLLFALAIGIQTGGSDHVVYLLPGMRLADPTFLTTDWFLNTASVPHRAFMYTVAAMAWTGHLVSWLAVATILQSVLLAIGVWFLAVRLYDEPVVPWGLTLVALAATHTRGVGLSWLLVPQYSAATISAVAIVGGLAVLANGRNEIVAGLLFGLGALFHANFAVLMVPVLGLTAIYLVVAGQPRKAIALVLPCIVLGSPTYLQVVAHIREPQVDLASSINVARFSHNYDPRTWGPAQGLLFGVAVAAGAVGIGLRPPRESKPFFIAIVTMVVMTVTTLVIGYAGLSETVINAMPWRLSSIVMVCLFLAIAAAVFAPPEVGPWFWLRRTLLVVIGLAAVVALIFGSDRQIRLGAAAATFLFFASRSGWLSRGGPRAGRVGLPLAAGVLVLGLLPAVWQGIRDSHVEIRTEAASPPELYEWVRANTPSDAVFAIPPGWTDFRLLARRAIITDHRSPPIDAAGLVAWAERLEDLTGLRPGPDAAPFDTAFLAADCGRMSRLATRYGARYGIRRTGMPPCGQLVYSGPDFAVVDMLAEP